MLPFLAALFFMLLLGKKVLVPNSALFLLALALVTGYFYADVDTNYVLITLFVASPFFIRFKYSSITRFAFLLGVLLPLLFSTSL